jgi:hypothetical protein
MNWIKGDIVVVGGEWKMTVVALYGCRKYKRLAVFI